MANNEIQNNSMLGVGTFLRDCYRIDRYLSSGGFGNTYIAMNTNFDETVAIKEFFMRGVNRRGYNNVVEVAVSDAYDQFIEQLDKFKKEARRLRKLHNEHIVAVHDIFNENGTSYYVMDYIDGESIGERLKRTGRPLGEEEALKYFNHILDALQEVHGKTFFHLDIKPANILIEKSTGLAKLIDFGASKQMRLDGGATRTAMCYTPGYAPSEQVEQQLDCFGPWTDLYALGATLYSMLAADKPPKSGDIIDFEANAFIFPENVSQATRLLVMELMRPSRKKRPQNVNAVYALMQQLGLPILNRNIDAVEVIEEPDEAIEVLDEPKQAEPKRDEPKQKRKTINLKGVKQKLAQSAAAKKQQAKPEANVEPEQKQESPQVQPDSKPDSKPEQPVKIEQQPVKEEQQPVKEEQQPAPEEPLRQPSQPKPGQQQPAQKPKTPIIQRGKKVKKPVIQQSSQPQPGQQFGTPSHPQPGQQFGTPSQPQPGQQFGTPSHPQRGQQFGTPSHPQPGQQFGTPSHPQPGQQFGTPSQPQPGMQFGTPSQPQPGQQFGTPSQPQRGMQFGTPSQPQPGQQFGTPSQPQPGMPDQGAATIYDNGMMQPSQPQAGMPYESFPQQPVIVQPQGPQGKGRPIYGKSAKQAPIKANVNTNPYAGQVVNNGKKNESKLPLMIGIIIGIIILAGGITFLLLSGNDTTSSTTTGGGEQVVEKSYTVTRIIGNDARKVSYTFTGSTAGDKPNGNGKGIYDDGTYEGLYVNGMREGHGVFTFKNGSTFDGEFKNDLMYKGDYRDVMKNMTFKGTFKNDEPFNGTWMNANGRAVKEVIDGKEK